jgi:hypothetical protein
MANLTKDQPLRWRDTGLFIERFVCDNSTAQTIYRGQPVIIDASADTVNVRGWVSTITLVTGNDIFVGIANEHKVVNTSDVEATNEIEVITKGEIGIKSAVFTDADIGKTVSMTDSGTLVAGVWTASQLQIGKLRRVEDGYAFIELAAPVIQAF